MQGFTGRIFLITGGTEGVGYATAKLALTRGASVVITGRNSDKGTAATKQLSKTAGSVAFVSHDASDAVSWHEVIEQVAEHFGGLHVLVNNAGMHIAKPFMETTLDEFDALFNLNIRGVFAATQAAVPLINKTLGEGEYGAIINVSSGAAFKPACDESVYSASKGALQILTRALAREFGSAGLRIRVNSVNPGIVETPMLARGLKELVETGVFESETDAREALRSDYPLGRFAMPEDVAQSILFLASDEADYLTGVALPVDGGETA